MGGHYVRDPGRRNTELVVVRQERRITRGLVSGQPAASIQVRVCTVQIATRTLQLGFI